MVTIHVLKPFTWHRMESEPKTVPSEQVFFPGEHVISDEMADHPWIAQDFADGRIERPQDTIKRLETKKVQADLTKSEADASLKAAQAAFDRLERTQTEFTQGNQEAAARMGFAEKNDKQEGDEKPKKK